MSNHAAILSVYGSEFLFVVVLPLIFAVLLVCVQLYRTRQRRNESYGRVDAELARDVAKAAEDRARILAERTQAAADRAIFFADFFKRLTTFGSDSPRTLDLFAAHREDPIFVELCAAAWRVNNHVEWYYPMTMCANTTYVREACAWENTLMAQEQARIEAKYAAN